MDSEFPLFQKISDAEDHDFLSTPQGLGRIAEYANGIAPSKHRIEDGYGQPGENMLLTQEAQAQGLLVFPHTLRADRLSPYARTFDN